jgi:tetratricopeptide (TPR) repeat protein
VEQSYPQAITYQNDLVLRAERLWKIEKSEEHARLLIKQLRIYGDLYFQSDDNENAGGAYRMLLRYVQSMKESFSFPFLADAESAAYTNLGELAYHKKDIPTAIAYATEALTVTKEAYDKTPTDILAYSLALIYFNLGTYHEFIISEDSHPEWFEDEMPKETIAYLENIVCLFKSAAELFEVLSRKKGFEDTAFDLFSAYYHAEQMLSILERNDEARAYIRRAREILVMLRDELDEDDAERANFDEWIDQCDLELDLLDLSDLV